MALVDTITITSLNFCEIIPLLATATEAENAPMVLSGVLASLVVIYLASTIGRIQDLYLQPSTVHLTVLVS